MSSKKECMLCLAVVVYCFLPSASRAGTIGHWRFEDTPGFLMDESGNGNHLSVLGTVTQATLPGSGPGSTIPTVIPQTLATNMKAADFEGTSDSLTRTGISSVPTTQFTIEAFLHWANSTNNNGAGEFADGIFGTQNAGNPGFFFQIRTDGILGSNANGELLLTVNNGSTNFLIFSGFEPTLGTDYYMAASFDLSGSVFFYVKDLTADGPLQIFEISHSVTGTSLNAAATNIEVGGFLGGNTGFDFDGLIDEIRLSDVALNVSELLITAQPVPIPEPASFALIGLGMFALRRKLRQS